MAETSYPNPGVTQLQHERLLGRAMPSGLLGHPDDPVLVYANGTGTREVRIRADRQAVVEGYGWQNDGVEVVKTLAVNSSGSPRVDLLVLRLNRADWSVTVQVVQGTPGAGAPSPTYNTGSSGVWELPLATVAVANGATTLAASTVTALAWYVGEDGQILCKASTRPPHSPGRRIREVDTGRSYESTGTTWAVLLDESGLSGFSMQPGFTATRNTLRRRNGFVTGQLSFRRNSNMSADTDYKVATIPAGFYPEDTLDLVGSVRDLSLNATASISDAGVLTVRVAELVVAGEIKLHPATWPVA